MEQTKLKQEYLDFENTTKKFTKMRFCIVSTYTYNYLKTSLQNFTLDYKE